MREYLLFRNFLLYGLFILTGCKEIPSYELINSRKKVIEVIYDDRIYRSDLESKEPTLRTINLKPDSALFLGIGNFKGSDIWPAYMEIRMDNDTIVLKGREAIYSLTTDNKIILK